MSVKKALALLLALPESKQKFGAFAYRNEQGLCCAVGRLLPATRKIGKKGISIRALMDKNCNIDHSCSNNYVVISGKYFLAKKTVNKIQEEANTLGLTDGELHAIQKINDHRFSSATLSPEERFKLVIASMTEMALNESNK